MRESKAKPSGADPAARGELISIYEAAKRYPLLKNWYYLNIKAKTLPFPHTPLSVGKTVIDTADIEDWIKSRKVPAGK